MEVFFRGRVEGGLGSVGTEANLLGGFLVGLKAQQYGPLITSGRCEENMQHFAAATVVGRTLEISVTYPLKNYYVMGKGFYGPKDFKVSLVWSCAKLVTASP